MESDLSDDDDRLISAYAKLTAAGGGDWAEGQFGALVEALESRAVSWNRDTKATKLIIMITDAPVHYANDGIGKLHTLPAFTSTLR